MVEMLNLKKNDILDLTKKNPGLKNVVLAAGWDVAKKGFFGLGHDYDLDLTAILLDENNKMIKGNSVIYYGNKRGRGIFLHGDNLTGEGDGDDEKITVTLKDLPESCKNIVFAVTIYDAINRRQNFSKVKNAYVRLLDADKNDSVICRFNLSEDGGKNTCIKFAELNKVNGEWQFKAVGEFLVASIQELANRYK